jgi:hypothetical protein
MRTPDKQERRKSSEEKRDWSHPLIHAIVKREGVEQNACCSEPFLTLNASCF